MIRIQHFGRWSSCWSVVRIGSELDNSPAPLAGDLSLILILLIAELASDKNNSKELTSIDMIVVLTCGRGSYNIARFLLSCPDFHHVMLQLRNLFMNDWLVD